jgi:hypothetical protein
MSAIAQSPKPVDTTHPRPEVARAIAEIELHIARLQVFYRANCLLDRSLEFDRHMRDANLALVSARDRLLILANTTASIPGDDALLALLGPGGCFTREIVADSSESPDRGSSSPRE